MSLFAALGPASGPLGVAGSVIGGIGAYASSKKKKKVDRMARRKQRILNKHERNKARRTFLKKFREAQAGVVSSSVVGGVDVSSSRFQQQSGAFATQARTAAHEFDYEEDMGLEISALQNKSAKYGAQAANYSSLAKFSSQFASFGGGGSDGLQEVKLKVRPQGG